MRPFKYVMFVVAAVAILASAASASAQGWGLPQGPLPPGGVEGVVQTVASTSLTILSQNNETITVTISDTTKVRIRVTGSDGTVSDIQVGSNVQVMGRKNSDGSIAAQVIVVEPAGDQVGGMVTAVSGATISASNRDGQVIIVTTDSTKFIVGQKKGSLSDVTKGKFVTAFGTKQTDGSLSATYVFVNGLPEPNQRPAPTPGQTRPGPGQRSMPGR